jgi:hypothetical protein
LCRLSIRRRGRLLEVDGWGVFLGQETELRVLEWSIQNNELAGINYDIIKHTVLEVAQSVAILLTHHARERMALRGIAESMVEEAIFTPDSTGEGYAGKLLAFKSFPHGRLRVVYFIEHNDHVIVSTIWED